MLKLWSTLSVRTRKFLTWGALVVGVGALVYEIAFNAFILTGALERVLSADPETLLVRYSSGWSLWPGHVHARMLRIRSRDSHVEFDLRIDRCVFDVSLLALARRKFHVLWIDGDGVAFRARRRLDPKDATPQTVDALPPIEGFERVPLEGPPKPPPDDAHYKLFTVELDRVDARTTREIWVDQTRFTGEAHVTGGFYLRPVRWASVRPALAEVRTGQLSMGDDVIATTITGSLSVTIDGFDPRLVEGAGIVARTSLHANLAGTLPGASFVRRWIDGGDVAVRGGAGDARLDVRVDHGRIISPGQVEIEAHRLVLESDRWSLEGDLQASATVSRDTGPDRLDAVIVGREWQGMARAAPGAPLRANRAELHMHSSRLDLSDHPFSDASFSARVPTVEIPDARVANAWLPAHGALRVESGLGTMGGQLDFSNGMAHGGALLGLDRLRFRAGKTDVVGALRVQAVLRAGNVSDGTFDLGGSRVDLKDVEMSGVDPYWWANVKLLSSVVSIARGVAWRSRLEVSARDTGPLLSIAVAEANVPSWAAAVLSARDLRATMALHVRPGAVDVSDLVLAAGSLRLDGEWTERGAKNHILLLVDAPILTVGVEKNDDGTHIQLLGARDWFRQHAHGSAAAGASR